MNHRTEEIIKQLNRLANDRNLATYTRNKLRDAISHIRELQLKLSELIRDPEIAMNERVERLETITSRQRDLIKKLEYENQHLKLKTRALTQRVRDLKGKSAAIDREPA